MRTKNPDWLYDGQIVYVNARLVLPDIAPGTGLRCIVESAHGDHGLIVNKERNFRRLMSRWNMWVIIEEKEKQQ